MAIAISDSVTVSMGDETSGARNVRLFVNGELKSTSSAVKSMNPGSMIKSLQKEEEIFELKFFIYR